MKHLFTFLFSLSLTLSIFAQNNGTCGENVTWSLSENTLTISGEGPMYDYSETTNPWASFIWNIRNIVIEDGVTSIGKNTFQGFYSLESLKIKGSVESIEEKAFANSNLRSVEIDGSVGNISKNAFSSCSSFESLIIDGDVELIQEEAFANSNLRNIEIRGSVTTIESKAFKSTTSLQSIIIEGNSGSIGDEAFANCGSLRNFQVNGSINSIGNGSFSGCSSMQSISLSSTLVSIGDNAFSGCQSLTSISLDATVPPSLGENVFPNNYHLWISIPLTAQEAYKADEAWKLIFSSLNFYIPSGINNMINSSKIISEINYYNLNGIKVTEPQSGVYIQVISYIDGSINTIKIAK